MQTKPWNGLRIRAAVIADAAMALTFASASIANATVVADPDEPGYAQDVDIETASSSWWGPPGNVIITHTIKTFGRYSQRPCLSLTTNHRERYTACDSNLVKEGARMSTPISVTETPAGAPHTITYRFNSSQIGNPRYYRWRAAAGGLYGDRTAYTREDLPQPALHHRRRPIPAAGRAAGSAGSAVKAISLG